MLKRKIEKKIENWLHHPEWHKAYMIQGARQVGKTYSIRAVLEREGVNYVELNFITDKDFRDVFDKIRNVDDLVSYASAYGVRNIRRGETVFFFDEVQECPELMTMIKFFVDEGSFRYILSGSLLGITFKKLRSAPVGYLIVDNMYPLDFEEFLQIYGFSPELKEKLRESFDSRTEVSPYIHEEMMKRFYYYLIVGGMPDAVVEYQNSHDFNMVAVIQKSITDIYMGDFSRYESDPTQKLFLTEIYRKIPSQLMNPNKRFNYVSVSKGLTYEEGRDSFLWLTAAGVAIPVYNIVSPTIPMLLNAKSNLFKLFLSDAGLLSYFLGEEARRAMILRAEDVSYGAIFENVTASELLAHGLTPYYYNSKKYGELDFVVEYRGKALAIEVKSGKTYTRHSALSSVLGVEEYGLDEAVVLSSHNISTDGKITYLPIYMLMFLEKEEGSLPSVDFSTLPTV